MSIACVFDAQLFRWISWT